MLTPSFWSKDTPETSSKQITSYWDEAPTSRAHVDEHVGDGRLAAGHEVRIRRHLLEEVRLAGASRSQLDCVVVADDERQHADEQHVLLTARESVRLEADAAQQQLAPLVEREAAAALDEGRQRVTGGHLDGPDRLHPERLTALLICQRGDVLERDLGVETTGEHPLVLIHEVR
jgi:hypothetical protein